MHVLHVIVFANKIHESITNCVQVGLGWGNNTSVILIAVGEEWKSTNYDQKKKSRMIDVKVMMDSAKSETRMMFK